MSFLAPLYLGFLALAVPIILLWFLRQRREDREVPTNFLWRRAAEEERASPLLRNLTRSILLLLQLAALLLLVATLAGAVLNLRLEGAARKVILLVDRSASMGVVENGGHTRLDLARKSAERLLETLRDRDAAMLIAFDESAQTLTGLSSDRGRLEGVLRALEPSHLGTEPAEGLRVAAATAAAHPEGAVEVFLFSDGSFGALPELPAALAKSRFHYVGIGSETENVGIVAVALDTDMEGGARVFVRLWNLGKSAASRTLSFLKDGVVLDARTADLGPREGAGAAFDLAGYGTGAFELRLEPGDAYAADDRASFVVSDHPLRRILLVTEGSRTLTRLADFHPRVEAYAVSPEDLGPAVGADVGGFELVVFDGVGADRVTPGTGFVGNSAVYLGCVPPDSQVELGGPIAHPAVVDWDRNHPLNQSVDWGDVLLAEGAPVVAPEGSAVLLETTAGPLVVALPGRAMRLVFGFRLEQSNMPLRLAFPIFFANVLAKAFGENEGGAGGFLPTGTVLTRPLPRGAEGAVLVDASGRESPLTLMPDGTVSIAGIDRSGLYTLRYSGDVESREPIAVGFLSSSESDIAPRDAVELAGEARPSDPGAVETNYPLFAPLLLLCLAVLTLEWILWISRGRRRRRGTDGDAPAIGSVGSRRRGAAR